MIRALNRVLVEVPARVLAELLVMGDRIRRAGESRGFAVSRVLTHWEEIAGSDLSTMCRPVEVSYGRGGFGATLTVLTTGAFAPMVEMQKDQLRKRVNAIYGYNAIARVRVTQTAPTGFADGQATFLNNTSAPDARTEPKPNPAAKQAVHDVTDADLRKALERLGENVLSNVRK